jgi:hypothetical protein
VNNLVNIIVRGRTDVWEDLATYLPSQNVSYTFSSIPISADFHVFMHSTRTHNLKSSKKNVAFVLAEPPEIRKYSKKFLSSFGTVFSAEFEYLASLPNLIPAQGLLPRMAGLPPINSTIRVKSIEELMKDTQNRPIKLSVINSTKSITPIQKRRIEFIEKLSNDVPGIEVYGRGFRNLEDKSSVLLASQFTIGIENSQHHGYWTEKLIDPILCGARCFYFGDPTIKRIFKSPIEIDIFDYESSLQTILVNLERDAGINEIKSDQKAYLTHFNILVEIDKWISAIKIKPRNSTSTLRIPNSEFLYTNMLRLKNILEKN